MNSPFTRIIAVLLAACLVGEPAQAVSLLTDPGQRQAGMTTERFASQALAATLISSRKILAVSALLGALVISQDLFIPHAMAAVNGNAWFTDGVLYSIMAPSLLMLIACITMVVRYLGERDPDSLEVHSREKVESPLQVKGRPFLAMVTAVFCMAGRFVWGDWLVGHYGIYRFSWFLTSNFFAAVMALGFAAYTGRIDLKKKVNILDIRASDRWRISALAAGSLLGVFYQNWNAAAIFASWALISKGLAAAVASADPFIAMYLTSRFPRHFGNYKPFTPQRKWASILNSVTFIVPALVIALGSHNPSSHWGWGLALACAAMLGAVVYRQTLVTLAQQMDYVLMTGLAFAGSLPIFIVVLIGQYLYDPTAAHLLTAAPLYWVQVLGTSVLTIFSIILLAYGSKKIKDGGKAALATSLYPVFVNALTPISGGESPSPYLLPILAVSGFGNYLGNKAEKSGIAASNPVEGSAPSGGGIHLGSEIHWHGEMSDLAIHRWDRFGREPGLNRRIGLLNAESDVPPSDRPKDGGFGEHFEKVMLFLNHATEQQLRDPFSLLQDQHVTAILNARFEGLFLDWPDFKRHFKHQMAAAIHRKLKMSLTFPVSLVFRAEMMVEKPFRQSDEALKKSA